MHSHPLSGLSCAREIFGRVCATTGALAPNRGDSTRAPLFSDVALACHRGANSSSPHRQPFSPARRPCAHPCSIVSPGLDVHPCLLSSSQHFRQPMSGRPGQGTTDWTTCKVARVHSASPSWQARCALVAYPTAGPLCVVFRSSWFSSTCPVARHHSPHGFWRCS